MIADCLDTRDMNALLRCSKFFYDFLIQDLYRLNAQRSGSSALMWAASEDMLATAILSLENGGIP